MPAPTAPGTGAMRISSRRRSSPAAGEQATKAHLDPGRRADASSLERREVAARDLEVAAHDEKPVHALRQRAEQLDALPLGKAGERAVRGAGDEIDLAVAQRLIAAVDRKDQLGGDVEPLGREKPELRRGERREIRVRDQVG